MAWVRGFAPRYVRFDGWYASLENLKRVRDHGWRWLTHLSGNRLATPADRRNRALDTVAIAASGRVVRIGLRPDPGLPDRHLQSRHEILGYRRPGDGRRDAAALRRDRFRDRELSSVANTKLRRGAVPGPHGAGAASSHRVGEPGVPVAGMAILHHRDQWVRGEAEADPGSPSELLGAALHYTVEVVNCITSTEKMHYQAGVIQW